MNFHYPIFSVHHPAIAPIISPLTPDVVLWARKSTCIMAAVAVLSWDLKDFDFTAIFLEDLSGRINAGRFCHQIGNAVAQLEASDRKRQKKSAWAEVDHEGGGLGWGGWGDTSSLNLLLFLVRRKTKPETRPLAAADESGVISRAARKKERKKKKNRTSKYTSWICLSIMGADKTARCEEERKDPHTSTPPLSLQRLWWGRNKCIFCSFLLPFFSFPTPKLLPGWSYRYPCQKLTQNRRKAPLISDKSWGNRWVFEPICTYGTFQSRWGKKKRYECRMGAICSSSDLKRFTTCRPVAAHAPNGCTLFWSFGSFYHRCRLWFLPSFIKIYFFYFCTISSHNLHIVCILIQPHTHLLQCLFTSKDKQRLLPPCELFFLKKVSGEQNPASEVFVSLRKL